MSRREFRAPPSTLLAWHLESLPPNEVVSEAGFTEDLACRCLLDSCAQCTLMPVIPIPRRVRSFHGPHTTCMHSACGSTHSTQLVRTKYNNFDLYLRSRCMYSFLRFLLYFGCSLLTSLLWVALSALFFLQYVSVRVLLRLQYKLSVILLLLGHRRLDFGLLNSLIIYSMQITMFLVGGLGWCFMVFVDM